MSLARWAAAALIAAGGVAWSRSLPPPAVPLDVPVWAERQVRGVFHVHTRRSDGTGTAADVAAAARRAGLQFVVLTDHGDGARQADAPAYLDGVLVVDAVEISTDHGHVVALGLPPSPYPLGGEARDVLDDVRRTGAFAIAAHPGSPRDALRWTEWNLAVDGIEWLNGDSEWRDESWPSLLWALTSYPVRREETLAALFDRPDDVLRGWDTMTEKRPVVALAAGDAHARLGLGGDASATTALRVPSYERVFRAFSITLPTVTLGGDAQADANAIIEAIRRGHVFSSVDGLAGPAALSFTAESGGSLAAAGDRLRPEGPVAFLVRSNAPRDARITLVEGGVVRAMADGPTLEYTAEPRPGAYRVEIQLADAPGAPPVPWVLSNPIYVGPSPRDSASPATAPAPSVEAALYEDGAVPDWLVEKSPRSAGELDVVPTVDGTQVLLRYGLGGTRSESPFVAIAVPVSQAGEFDRLRFRAHASRPTRMSVQIRAPGGASSMRWQRSVYLDETARDVEVPFDQMRPIGPAPERPALDSVRHVLFVLDTVNSAPDASGQIWVDRVSFVR